MKKLIIALLASTALTGSAVANETGSFCFHSRVHDAYLKILSSQNFHYGPLADKLKRAILDAFQTQELKRRASQGGVATGTQPLREEAPWFQRLIWNMKVHYEMHMDVQERVVHHNFHPDWALQVKCKNTMRLTVYLVELDTPVVVRGEDEFSIGKEKVDSAFVMIDKRNENVPIAEDPNDPILVDNEEYRDLKESDAAVGMHSVD